MCPFFWHFCRWHPETCKYWRYGRFHHNGNTAFPEACWSLFFLLSGLHCSLDPLCPCNFLTFLSAASSPCAISQPLDVRLAQKGDAFVFCCYSVRTPWPDSLAMHRSDIPQARSVWPASVVQLRILQLTQLRSGFYDGSKISPRSLTWNRSRYFFKQII